MTKNSFPRLIGKGFAHLQNGLDRLVEISAEKLRSDEVAKPKKGESTPKKLLRSGAKALGETLDAFYAEYNALKAERKGKK